MIRNYLLVATRSIRRYATYSVINVMGLALGMASALLIFSLVKYHLSFDTQHADVDRIYRIVTEQHRDVISYSRSVPAPLGRALREDYDFTEKVGRIFSFDEVLLRIEQNGTALKFDNELVAFAEPDYFDIFHFDMIAGDAKLLLNSPHAAIITESKAKKFFGNQDPIDKVIRLDNKLDFKVVGVMKDLPVNTELRSEVYLSFGDLKEFDAWFIGDSWGGIASPTQCYVKLKPGVNIPEMEDTMFGYVKKFRPRSKNVHHYRLQAMSDVHFSPLYGGSMSERNLWALSMIGFFLVITACVNFINMATASATSRAREVGVRKVLGGMRKQLFWQFMTETLAITIVSMIIAFTVAYAIIPFFNEWFGTQVAINLLSDSQLLLFIPILILAVTLISGAYPGLILSGFQPVVALKGKLTQLTSKGLNLRRSLIVSQFTISQILIIVLIVIVSQMRYSKNTDLGFDRNAVMIVPIGANDERPKTLKSQIAALPGVEGVSLCYTPPSWGSNWTTSVVYDRAEESEVFSSSSRLADEDYLSTFDIKLIAGRNILPSDTVREYLVNEAFVRKKNLSNPEDVIGHILTVDDDWTGPIVGVVKDFHDASMHEEIKPVFIANQLSEFQYIAIKFNPANITEVKSEVDQLWSAAYPELVFSTSYLDETIAEFYETEATMLLLVQIFSLVAIIVGCIGLFGLVSFMSVQRTKEIGIRKVLGGNLGQILWIFGKEFSLLVVLSFAIAAPAGWWLMNQWLEDFEYQIDIGASVFLLTFIVTSMIVLITVGFRSIRAATANPVNSLRSE